MATVLLIDDDEHFRRLSYTVLGGRGHQVFEIGRCGQADKLIARVEPDLILLEVALPDCDGTAWLRGARAKGMRVPVLLTTSAQPTASQQRALADSCGVGELLAKPTSATALVAKVSRMLSARGAPETLDALLPPAEAIALEEMRREYAAQLPRLMGGLRAAIAQLRATPRDGILLVRAQLLARHLAGMAGSFGFAPAGLLCANVERALQGLQGGDKEALATLDEAEDSIRNAA